MEDLSSPAPPGTPSGNPRNGQAMPGASFDPVIALIREANHVMGCYGRHFAGQARATRDLRTLDELAVRLRSLRDRMRALGDADRARAADRLASLDQQLALLEGEHANVRQARAAGTLAEQSSFLAVRINEQFALYRVHFAGQSRLSRRPGLLRRIITSLEDIRGELADAAFDALKDRSGHAGNLTLVEDNLVSLGRELSMIDLEHQGASLMERTAALGQAANTDLRAYNLYYAGQDRATRDPERLGHICDRLGEIELQLADMARRVHSDAVTRSLDAVQISLDLYQSEHEQVLRLRRPPDTIPA